jgi:hypothetical protein
LELDAMKNHWQQLLREPSTYRGMVWLITAAGIALSPEQQQVLITLGAAIAGAMGIFFTDKQE